MVMQLSFYSEMESKSRDRLPTWSDTAWRRIDYSLIYKLIFRSDNTFVVKMNFSIKNDF